VYGVAPSGPAQYYVTVALFDAATGQRIDDATMTARVSTAKAAGPEKRVERITVANSASYGNYFAMADTGPYKVTVRVSDQPRWTPLKRSLNIRIDERSSIVGDPASTPAPRDEA
jgi:hypothetical protein